MTATETRPATADDYLAGETAETFDWQAYFAKVVPDPQLVRVAEGRRALTEMDPLLFALIYMPHLIVADASMPEDQEGNITFSELHLALCRYALSWARRAGPRESRNAFVAPRNCGKSTWLFLILPAWAMAHGHVNFVAAFSSAGPQATKHLAAFKAELDTNLLLREDFPDLCKPRKRVGGQNVADTQKFYYSHSQQSFFAAGLDEEILGLTDPRKRRPELIILDDVEPDEANYSAHLAQKRRISVRDTILPMNENAHVALVGTVTMLGSLVHQLVQTVIAKEPPAEWIRDERFNVHYFAPIIDGVRSIWPAKWPLEWLLDHQRERSYKKNFLNQPVPESSAYWQEETFTYGAFSCARWLVQIDPATTKTATSDYYGIAVIGFRPAQRDPETHAIIEPAKCLVVYARAFRFSPAQLVKHVNWLISVFPAIGRARIEVNQGGDTWKEVLRGVAVRLYVHTESVKKEVRAADLLTWYERRQVVHAEKLTEAEMQMMAFPNVLHDDLVDAIGAGVRFFLEPKKLRARIRSASYI